MTSSSQTTPSTSTRLPDELVSQIFTYLDISSLLECTLASKSLSRLVDSRMWRNLSLRDFHYFLHQEALTSEEIASQDYEIIQENAEEAGIIFTNPFKQPLLDNEKQKLEENSSRVRNWKRFYMDCFKLNKNNLSGLWVGDYGEHGFELLKIFHKGYHVYAQKLSGDDIIPAKKLTWKMTLDKNMKKGKGYIHLADEGYRNSRWNTALIDMSDPNVFKITWVSEAYGICRRSVTFSNVRIGKAEFKPETMARKQEVIIVSDAAQLLDY